MRLFDFRLLIESTSTRFKVRTFKLHTTLLKVKKKSKDDIIDHQDDHDVDIGTTDTATAVDNSVHSCSI